MHSKVISSKQWRLTVSIKNYIISSQRRMLLWKMYGAIYFKSTKKKIKTWKHHQQNIFDKISSKDTIMIIFHYVKLIITSFGVFQIQFVGRWYKLNILKETICITSYGVVAEIGTIKLLILSRL